MKPLKKTLTLISFILLPVLILCFSLTFTVKNFVIEEVAPNTIKELLRKEYVKTNKLDSDKLNVLDRVFYDKNTNSTIEIIINNFLEYQDNKSAYKVKEKDLKIVREFMVKHRQDLSDFSNKELTDEKIIDHFQVDVINDEVIDIFEKVDKDLNRTGRLVFDVYSKVTSSTTSIILIASMATLIGIILLLNLPIVKSIDKIGISILISGIVLALMYAALLVLKDKVVTSLKLNLDLGSIKFDTFLIWSMVEIAIGTLLIIIKKLFLKKSV